MAKAHEYEAKHAHEAAAAVAAPAAAKPESEAEELARLREELRAVRGGAVGLSAAGGAKKLWRVAVPGAPVKLTTFAVAARANLPLEKTKELKLADPATYVAADLLNEESEEDAKGAWEPVRLAWLRYAAANKLDPVTDRWAYDVTPEQGPFHQPYLDVSAASPADAYA